MMDNQQPQQDADNEQAENDFPVENPPAPEINEPLDQPITPSQELTPGDVLLEASPLPPKRSNKILLALVLIVVGLLLAGGGVFAYFNYFQSPEKNIQKMITKLPAIKSLEYSGETNSEIKMGDLPSGQSASSSPVSLFPTNKNFKTSVKYSGALDIQEAANPKLSLAINVETDLLPMLKLVIGANLRLINKVVYAQFNDLPNLGFLDLSAISNQWIKIDPAALQNQPGLKQYEDQIKTAQEKQKLSPEQSKKIGVAFKQAKVIEITEKLASEKIEGVDNYHYKYIINAEGLKKYLADYDKIVPDKALTGDQLAAFDKGFAAVESLGGEIWIGKKDLLPYKITSDLIIKETEKSKTSGKISSTLSFKNFNQPVQIEVPTPVKTVEEVTSALFGGLLTSKPGAALPIAGQPGVSQDTDNDGLTDQQEIIYGTNSNNPDTDGDGYKDGAEVKSGYNPNGAGKLLK